MIRSLLVVPLLLLCACTDGTAQAAEPTAATLSVTGRSEVRAQPDTAQFAVSVISAADDARTALDENARIAERLLAALRDAGTDDDELQTRGVRVTPEFSRPPRDPAPDWRPQTVGYRAENQITVTTRQLANVGLLMAAATEAGADRIQGLYFSLEDDAGARREAIEAATRKAMSEAAILASAAGARPGAIVELRLDGASGPLRVMAAMPMERMRAASMDAMAAPPVEPGEITVTAHVTVTLAVEQ